MRAKFECPVFKRKENPSGVYKISFGDSWYYIGGSAKLKTRFIAWKTRLKHRTNKNKKLTQVAQEVDLIKFEILELTTAIQCKKRETEYIQKHWDDPFLLNCAPNAENNIGIKHNKHGDFKINRKAPPEIKRPIAIFSIDGNLIKTFEYMTAAAEFIKGHKKNILSFLRGKCSQYKGYRFKLMGEGGAFIEPIGFISKKKPLKVKKAKYPPTPCRPMVKYDEKGVELNRYGSFNQLCKALGTEKSSLRRMLAKGRPGYYKGFFYKEA